MKKLTDFACYRNQRLAIGNFLFSLVESLCGFYLLILSLDDGDDFTISGFSKDEGVGIRSLRKVLKELEKNGYYRQKIVTNENGRKIGVYHIFYDDWILNVQFKP